MQAQTSTDPGVMKGKRSLHTYHTSSKDDHPFTIRQVVSNFVNDSALVDVKDSISCLA